MGRHDHGKKDLTNVARERLHKQSREMAKEKPDGASMQEQIRQDLSRFKGDKGGER